MAERRPSCPTYEYEGIDPQTRTHLENQANAIRKKLLITKRAVIEIGERLLQVKAILPHGHFGRWVVAHCDFTLHTAKNFMNAAEFANKHKNLSKISQTGLFLLAAPKLNEEIRRRVIQAVETGAATSSTEIRQLIHKEKVEANFGSEKKGNGTDDDVRVIEFASILIGALPQPDLDRVLSIASSAKVTLDRLADALRSNLPTERDEHMLPDEMA